MKFLVQRVKGASLRVSGSLISEIGAGLVIYVGFKEGDSLDLMDKFVDKLLGLRIFEDENNKLNRSLIDISGEVMFISNFTLYGDSKHGFRPSFSLAMKFSEAEKYYNIMFNKMKAIIGDNIKKGIFGADMEITSICDGPVNIIIE